MSDSRSILEAIALRRCIEVTYNRMRMKLAPHILYSRHNDLFVDAVTVEREGRVAEMRLGTFKLAGLQIARVIAQSFEPHPVFEPDNAKYHGVTLLAVR